MSKPLVFLGSSTAMQLYIDAAHRQGGSIVIDEHAHWLVVRLNTTHLENGDEYVGQSRADNDAADG